MTKWDKILIILTFVLSLAGIAFVSSISMDSSQKYAIIRVDGEIAKKISISGIEKNQVYDFQFGIDNKGYIEINNGEVRMLEMDKVLCPEGICSDTGWISKKYQSIVCLPNRLIVEFEQNIDEELDIMSY